MIDILIFAVITFIGTCNCANWAQLAGLRAQKITTPYEPSRWNIQTNRSRKPMWSARWGHTLIVLNDTSYIWNETTNRSSSRSSTINPILVLIGGDDYGQSSDGIFHVRDRVFLSGGFLNDVWISKSLDPTLEDWNLNETWRPLDWSVDFSALISKMTWEQTNSGRGPPVTWTSGTKKGTPMTYDDWIQCQDYFFLSRSHSSELCNDHSVKRQNMFSPRRGHGSVVAHNVLYVIGGRAQEYVVDENTALFQGIIDLPVETFRDHRSIREDVILKNDVWVSDDGLGYEWRLITPGCKDPQLDLVKHTVAGEHKLATGSWGNQCIASSDCYGEAVCSAYGIRGEKICICPMFGSREHHSVSVQHRSYTTPDGKGFSEDYIYIVGGFTDLRMYFCSSLTCARSSTYRMALDDAWVSNNGRNWIQLKPVAAKSSDEKYRGRGAHASLLVHSKHLNRSSSVDKLLIFGGETVSPTNITSVYLNDVWSLDLQTEPCCIKSGACHDEIHSLTIDDVGSCLPSMEDWQQVNTAVEWAARSGHVAVYEPPSNKNQYHDLIYIYGGENGQGTLGDMWVWELGSRGSWTQDFDDDQIYRIGNKNGTFVRAKDQHQSPYRSYFHALSPLAQLYVELLPSVGQMGNQSMQPIRKSILTDRNINALEKSGLKTVRDLSQADIYTILRLRGVDPPIMENNIVPNICYAMRLSKLLVAKCSLNDQRNVSFLPLTVTTLCRQSNNTGDFGEERLDPRCVAENWDGCEPIDGYTSVNVYKVGEVPVPQRKEDVLMDIKDLHCRVTPQPRTSATAVYYHEKVLIAGGKGYKDLVLFQDVWHRDDMFPQASISSHPKTNTTDTTFKFEANKPGTFLIEYKIFDPIERLDVTPWIATTTTEGADLSWLDRNTGGPGNGWYTIYSRAIDSNGNHDIEYSLSSNCYNWYYISPRPWGKIIGLTTLFLTIICYIYTGIRRRIRKKALEKIVLQRMRQKYKFRPDPIWQEKKTNDGPNAPPFPSTNYSKIDIESTKAPTDRSKRLINRKNYRMNGSSSSSDSDCDRNKFLNQSTVINRNANINSSTRSFTWDDFNSSDSDTSAAFRRRRELEHRGKISVKGRRAIMNRPNGRISPKKSS